MRRARCDAGARAAAIVMPAPVPTDRSPESPPERFREERSGEGSVHRARVRRDRIGPDSLTPRLAGREQYPSANEGEMKPRSALAVAVLAAGARFRAMRELTAGPAAP